MVRQIVNILYRYSEQAFDNTGVFSDNFTSVAQDIDALYAGKSKDNKPHVVLVSGISFKKLHYLALLDWITTHTDIRDGAERLAMDFLARNQGRKFDSQLLKSELCSLKPK